MKNRKLSLLLCSAIFAFMSSTAQVQVDPPTSKALPTGMRLVWHDEFNGQELNDTKWFTQYYSQLDYVNKTNWEDFQAGTMPEPAMFFTDSSIVLFTNDSLPERTFWKNGRKISSIQTYDWRSDKTTFDNRLGGYMEARIRRSATPEAKQVNGAFWIDAPGPDSRYFVEKGNTALGVEGIRPRGQVFEIDLCEYITTEIVLHGNVSPEGRFQRNIGHHIVQGEFNDKWVVHSMLWTPAGLKFYIDGELIYERWDPNDIKSPNHLMSIFLGAYGNGGEVQLECDYVRFYQWELEENSELPNAGFEYDGTLFPWEGKGNINSAEKYTGKQSVELMPGDTLYQYVYLDHSKSYTLDFYGKGKGNIAVQVENITQVSGESENVFAKELKLSGKFKKGSVQFTTNTEFGDHSRTVKVSLINKGKSSTFIDDLKVFKSN